MGTYMSKTVSCCLYQQQVRQPTSFSACVHSLCCNPVASIAVPFSTARSCVEDNTVLHSQSRQFSVEAALN